jgi:hypothetical protein
VGQVVARDVLLQPLDDMFVTHHAVEPLGAVLLDPYLAPARGRLGRLLGDLARRLDVTLGIAHGRAEGIAGNKAPETRCAWCALPSDPGTVVRSFSRRGGDTLKPSRTNHRACR